MAVVLQMLGGYGLGRLVLLLVVPVLVVAFGSYVGVLVALQSFFGASSWEEVVDSESDES
ncbi:hypothetical protein BV210_09655 [Halorientalis sp. IM1011]|uniref:hypothetical protein n=1 Tax=Halorientalis sp. IM1011 TaxID=1932360 RepID=UPI00097CCDB8|nr:hypothetical protein [Halorientalis sp. IM1011]AQL42964.1 hypothetical protein BV210_09655 [Halorientalis sp. IM1011]